MSGLRLPRVAAVHDLSGFGKCGLAVAIPVLSAMGVEVCTLPTAVLSTNTAFAGFRVSVFTEFLDEHAKHWQEIGLAVDTLYSGWLANATQIAVIERAVTSLCPRLVVVDPVMGDDGKAYKMIDATMTDGFRRLSAKADVLTPNLTEACLLTGMEYNPSQNADSMRDLAKRLRDLGAKSVVVKGIIRGDRLINGCLDDNIYEEIPGEHLPYKMFGTGDLFASVLAGKLTKGASLFDAASFAGVFVRTIMRETVKYEDYARRGLVFEPYLQLLGEGKDYGLSD